MRPTMKHTVDSVFVLSIIFGLLTVGSYAQVSHLMFPPEFVQESILEYFSTVPTDIIEDTFSASEMTDLGLDSLITQRRTATSSSHSKRETCPTCTTVAIPPRYPKSDYNLTDAIAKYSGKNALVTGTSYIDGNGWAIMKKLKSVFNMNVVGCARTKWNKLSAALKSEYLTLGVHYIQCDVRDRDSIRDVEKWIKKNMGVLDIVVSNVGKGAFGSPRDYKNKHRRDILETNCFAVSELFDILSKKGRLASNATILQISSIAAQIDVPFQPIYPSSKWCVESATQNLQVHYGDSYLFKTLEPTTVNTSYMFHLVDQEYDIDHYECAANRQIAFNRTVDLLKLGQSPDNVANAAIQLIAEGYDGDHWGISAGSAGDYGFASALISPYMTLQRKQRIQTYLNLFAGTESDPRAPCINTQ